MDLFKTRVITEADMSRKSVPIVCAGCNKVFKIEIKNVSDSQKTGVSHGYCPECLEKMHNDLDKE